MRIAWPTVGAIIERVVDDARRRSDPFEGLRRIGIDEIRHRRGQRYITVFVDHDSGRLLWAAPGRDQATVAAFFEPLSPHRCAKIELVRADAGPWIAKAVDEYCPNARRCMDPRTSRDRDAPRPVGGPAAGGWPRRWSDRSAGARTRPDDRGIMRERGR